MFRIRTCARTKCGGNALLVQEIAAVALVTSDNFLPKLFNKMTGFAKCLILEMVNRQPNDNDTESSINGNLSMGGSMLKQKISKLGYAPFYFVPSARSGCFGKGATGLCWKGLGVNAR